MAQVPPSGPAPHRGRSKRRHTRRIRLLKCACAAVERRTPYPTEASYRITPVEYEFLLYRTFAAMSIIFLIGFSFLLRGR